LHAGYSKVCCTHRKLLQDDLVRLITLWKEFPQLLDGQSEGDPSLSAPAQAALQCVFQIMQDPTAGEKQARLRMLLLDALRPSTLLGVEVKGFKLIKDRLPAAEDLLSPEAGEVSEDFGYRQIAREIVARELFPEEVRTAINQGLTTRIGFARHFLDLRRFAKLDALESR
jgi:hypothetical protein